MSLPTPVLRGPVLEDRAGTGGGQEVPRQAPGAAGEVATDQAETRTSRVMLQVRPPGLHAAGGQEGGQEVETLQGGGQPARCSAARGRHPGPGGGLWAQPGAAAPGRHGHPAARPRLQRAQAAGPRHQVSCTCTCLLHLSPAQVPAAERAEVPPAGQEGGGRQPPAGQHREHGGGGGAGGNTSAHALGLVTVT